jgi:large subunit ribosomal protein L3
MKGILGIKQDMSQIFKESGEVVPITLIDTSDCFLCYEKDENVKILGLKIKKNPNKPEIGKYKKVKKVPRFAKEFRGLENLSLGDKVEPNIFEVGEKVKVSGVSKGKGFAGVVKRWGFAGGPKTHGQSDKHRHGGSIGSGTTPGNVKKGKKMPGRSGNYRKTIKNIEVVGVKDNLLLLKGSVPGARGSLVVIESL